ncbi:tape measure protein [Erwinia sp. INIA-01]|uniref:tape measure protein n=1 Tax=Erwinia sp. INIA01 TaxID=2991500 RepID=UPI0022256F1E|nr:tape measure protein [Erwinia sp. INIA01]MCW1877662.1 tape measure protein [Erwinia sp. INIA01]
MSENAGGIYYDIEMDVRGLLTAQQRVNQRLDLMERGFDSTTRSINNTERSMSSLSGVAVALAAALSVKQVSEYADAWATVNNKLANSLRPNEQLAEVTERVFNITQQTRGSLDATASLYARLERATRQYGTSAGDLSKLTTIINQGFVVSGATAQEAENAIIQLSQGLASGALRGEEFNSVNEQGNRLIVALADSMGVSIGQMRNMAAQGKLTTDVVVNGLLSQGAVIGAEFANTTTTISQALQVAGNNITKFFGENSTVKTAAGIFNDAVVSVSENISGLSAALTAVVAVMGSRYIGALTMAATGKVKLAIATREEIVAENQAAQAAANKATADLRAAAVAKERALDEVRVAQVMRNSSITAANLAAAEVRLSAARLEAATLTDNYNRALVANTAAQSAATVAAERASLSVTTLASKALGLIGGPAGAAMLAGAAIYYFYQKAKQAKQEAIDFSDTLTGLVSKMKDMSQTQIAAEIAKATQAISVQSDMIDDQRQRVDGLIGVIESYKRSQRIYGESTRQMENMQEAQRKLAIEQGRLEEMELRYSRTKNLTSMLQAQYNGLLVQGIDLLSRDGHEAGVATGIMNQLGKAMNFAAGAKERFNATSLVVTRPKDIQDYLDGQQEQIDLQSEFNERKREQLKAEMDIRNLAKKGTDANPEQLERDVSLARERAGVSFDQKKAEEQRRKEQQKSEQQDKKSASSAESVAQKLASLQQQAALTADSTQELTRAQAIQRAEQSLGKGATASQIQQAHDYAAAIWDTAAAIKARNAIPELKENADYTAQKSQLEMLKSATDANGKLLISQEQYNAASEQLEQGHQVRLSKIRAQQVSANPIAEARGEIDPVQALANQNNQKLALMQQYQQQEQAILKQSYQSGSITYDQYVAARQDTDAQYLALRTAQENQFNQQMTAAQWELLSQQGLGYNMLTSAVDSFAGNASNALTGLLTGTMSAQEAMRSLGNTILNSVLNSIVQTGVEMLKNFIVSQTLGAATQTANAAAATAGGAAALAAWTPAAIAASIATAGTASATGLSAYQTAQTAGLAMSVLGARKNGGPVSAGGLYQVGEGRRPEIYQASNGSQYMIPGDNGKVISNKDISGGGGITIINQIENYSSGAMVDTQASSDGNGNVTIQTIVTDIANGGQIGQAISNYHNAPRRARG